MGAAEERVSAATRARPLRAWASRVPRSTRWLIALTVLLAACGTDPRRAPMRGVTETLLAVASRWSAVPFDPARVRAELDRIASRVERAVAKRPGSDIADALHQVLFDELGFSREVDDTDLRFVLLPSVLAAKRGSCVGLGSLDLALGERLGVPLEAVMVPGHFYVRSRRAEREGHRNFELLRRGESMPDAWYAQRFPIPGGAAPHYARALTTREVRAVIEFDVGNERKRLGQLQDARAAYQAAAEHFPQFAEAHASLGMIAQLLGDLPQARIHYQAARRAHPKLPGLAHNLSLLDAERPPDAGAQSALRR